MTVKDLIAEVLYTGYAEHDQGPKLARMLQKAIETLSELEDGAGYSHYTCKYCLVQLDRIANGEE